MSTETEQVETFAELWGKLTPPQKRFAIAMQEWPTIKEAAEAIGISPNTAYNWNREVKEAVDFMTNNIALATLGILQANATKAAMVKAKGLDSVDERIAQGAATEIIDRNIGKVTQGIDHTSGGEQIKLISYITENRPDDSE